MSLADQLDAQALVLRSVAAGVIQSGQPVDVPWRLGKPKTLHTLTAHDIIDDAEALERDAAKLRLLH